MSNLEIVEMAHEAVYEGRQLTEGEFRQVAEALVSLWDTSQRHQHQGGLPLL